MRQAGTPARSTTRPILTLAALLAVACARTTSTTTEQAGTVAVSPSTASTGRRAEAVSVLGREFFARPDTGGLVAKADSAARRNPGNVDTLIAAGLANAAIWRFNDAIALYTRALALAPNNARLYRYRGHRYISVRRFDDAVRDLERGIALDSLSFDMAYHLGLAYYLTGEFGKAADAYARCVGYAESAAARALEDTVRYPRAYRSCMHIATSDDSRVAITEWRYRALRRAGRHDEAARLLESIRDGMNVTENRSYYFDLLVAKGLRAEAAVLAEVEKDSLQFVTAGYGLANQRLVRGDTTGARQLFERIVGSSNYWAGFGYIASEVELKRERTSRK